MSGTSNKVRAEIRKRVPVRNVPAVPHEHLRIDVAAGAAGPHPRVVRRRAVAGPGRLVRRGDDAGRRGEAVGDPHHRAAARWCCGATRAARLLAGPGTCPHLGALLDDCEVIRGDVVCRWHGMALGVSGRGGLADLPGLRRRRARVGAAGDGGGDPDRPADHPGAPAGMSASIAAVITIPGDVRAAGHHRQPARPVARGVVPPVCVQPPRRRRRRERRQGARRRRDVPAHPASRGAGAGRVRLPRRADDRHDHHRAARVRASVVETHATPLGPDANGRPVTMMTEATVAHSPRKGFAAARAVAGAGEAGRWSRPRPGCGWTTWRTPSDATCCGRGARTSAPDHALCRVHGYVRRASYSVADNALSTVLIVGAALLASRSTAPALGTPGEPN